MITVLTIEDLETIITKTSPRLSALGIVYAIINDDTDEEVTSRYPTIEEAWDEFKKTWVVGTFTVLTIFRS